MNFYLNYSCNTNLTVQNLAMNFNFPVLALVLPLCTMYNLRIAVLFSASKPTTTLRSNEPDVISAQIEKVSRSRGLEVNG